MKKGIITGILAHVDAGKTTLSEGILFHTGSIRRLGRVDHRDAFLDTHAQERARGITIFTKEARFSWKGLEVTLVDTPGHVDFSAEMERALQVMDYAVLVISGTDGVQSHTETLWRLLARYEIPVFVFVNKMDLSGADRATRMINLHTRLSENCVDFSSGNAQGLADELAVCSESLLSSYLDNGELAEREIAQAIKKRQVFPVYFGSALKLQGVDELLDGLALYCEPREYPAGFGAKVYKISRDEQGKRLTWMKLTGGSLSVREQIAYGGLQEKIDQIRLYNGEKYQTVDRAEAGLVCAVTGLSETRPGQGLGCEEPNEQPVLAPVMTYRLLTAPGQDAVVLLKQLRLLEEEDPLLHIRWNQTLQEIHVQLMGEVQIEVLTERIRSRFGAEVKFDAGSILYRETIARPVEGMGHYEPLRHYAEVHLLLEPGERGSGIVIDTACSEDELDRNWQRLIVTHLEEKEHLGVLTGSPLTDVKITLVAGRAHIKHTEGGDFRQATYRAVRHGLMRTESVLLEPYYAFRMELPHDALGRAMADLERMSGKFSLADPDGEMAVLSGTVPVAEMQGYAAQLASYTRGLGRLVCTMHGYEVCHNAEQVIARMGYRAEADLENTADSVFCAHGAGFLVSWEQAADYMHLEALPITQKKLGMMAENEALETEAAQRTKQKTEQKTESKTEQKTAGKLGASYAADKELEEIFTRTFGEIKRRVPTGANSLGEEKARKTQEAGMQAAAMQSVPTDTEKDRTKEERSIKTERSTKAESASGEHLTEYLLVDGYNVIFAWDELAALAKENLESARLKLMDILCNYQGYTQYRLILVFDAYRVKGNPGEVQQYHNIHVVYTKEAETADMYIEKVSHELGRRYRVTVATSDALEQLIVIGQGAVRISSRELKLEVERITKQKLQEYLERQPKMRNYAIKDALK